MRGADGCGKRKSLQQKRKPAILRNVLFDSEFRESSNFWFGGDISFDLFRLRITAPSGAVFIYGTESNCQNYQETGKNKLT